MKKQNSLRRIFTGPLVVCMLAMMLLPAAARFVAIRSVTVAAMPPVMEHAR